jgi:hypothetical protein
MMKSGANSHQGGGEPKSSIGCNAQSGKERSFEEDDKVTMVVTFLRIYELEWWTYEMLYWLEGVVSLASIAS